MNAYRESIKHHLGLCRIKRRTRYEAEQYNECDTSGEGWHIVEGVCDLLSWSYAESATSCERGEFSAAHQRQMTLRLLGATGRRGKELLGPWVPFKSHFVGYTDGYYLLSLRCTGLVFSW